MNNDEILDLARSLHRFCEIVSQDDCIGKDRQTVIKGLTLTFLEQTMVIGLINYKMSPEQSDELSELFQSVL